jgi:mRNA interferase RelE/StbE
VIYEVRVTQGVRREIKKLPRDVQQALVALIAELGNDPRPAGSKKLAGIDSCYRVRQGDYRVVYAVEDDQVLVLIVRVGHRRDVYDHINDVVKGRTK